MNLMSRKVRLPIAALGACALVTGGGVLAAGSAFAAETYTFQGATGNAASTVAVALNSPRAAMGYGVKVGGVSGAEARPIQLEVLSAPTNGLLASERVAGNGNPATGTFTGLSRGVGNTPVTVGTTADSKAITFSAAPTNPGTAVDRSLDGEVIRIGAPGGVPGFVQYGVVSDHAAGTTTANISVVALTTATGLAGASATGNNYVTTPSTKSQEILDYESGDNLYVGAAAAGTYTFRLFADTAEDGIYQANADDATPTFTLTVKSPADAFSFAAPSSVVAGTTGAKATVTPSVSTTDIRGGATPALGTAIAAGLGIAIVDDGTNGVTGEGVGSTVLYNTTDGMYRFLATDGTTALTQGAGTPKSITSTLSFNGTAIAGATKTTTVDSNDVDSLVLAVKSGQTSDVNVSGGTATVRVGKADVTYTATAKDVDGDLLSGKDVTFTLAAGTGTALTDLKANGASVPVSGEVTVKTVNGVASLTVTSTKTANGNEYSVEASSGTEADGPITAQYETTAPDTVTASSVAALVGGTATLTGKVVDQFGEPYSASGLTAALAITGSATPASGNYVIGSDGKFSATVNDTASNTTPRNDSFTWTVSGVSSGSKTLAWRTSITPGAVAIATTTIAGSATDTAIPFTSSTTRVDLATSGAFSGDVETVKGTISDTASTPAALPFAEVTYSGSDGVYFYDADNKLSKTMTAAATSTGKLSYDGTTDGIRVLFTKTGNATITAKSGSVTKSVTVPVETASDAYKVTAVDAQGKPGSTIAVTGTVKDIFGNPVVGQQVNLTLSDNSVGVLADSTPDSDANGVWSTTISPADNQDGEVTLTATIDGQTQNATADAAYATAGLTIGDGEYKDQATITVGNIPLTIGSSPRLSYGSKYYARGALVYGDGATPNTTVSVYARPAGGTYQLVRVAMADESGNWSVENPVDISKSTYFIAKNQEITTGSSSLTKVYSGVILDARSFSKDRATLSANGGPNAKAYLYFYREFANGDSKYLGKKLSNSYGNGSVTVKAPTGARKYKVLFRAPGTYTGSDTDYVKVK